MRSHERRALTGAVLLTLSTGACGGPPALAPRTPDLGHETGLATCAAAKDPLHPMIMEWPATQKTELEATSRQGAVVVSYVGCTMKVLMSCHASGGGTYDLQKTTPASQSVAIEDESQLRASLPLSAVSLRGELESGRRLTLDYVTMGEQILSHPPTLLSGDCAGATHYVSSMVVGAFRLTSEASLKASLDVGVASTGVSGHASGKKQIGDSSGDLDVCKAQGADNASCLGLLELGLSPLEEAGGKVTAHGFGTGLGALPVVPQMGELVEVQSSGGLGLDEHMVHLLQMLQAAKRADRDATTVPDAKASAWTALAQEVGNNPYAEAAAQRRDDWARVAAAKRQRDDQLAKAWDRYQVDRANLDKIMALDDDVVSPEKKAAYKREFTTVYASWIPELEQIHGSLLSPAERAEEERLGAAEAHRREEQRVKDEAAAQSDNARASNRMVGYVVGGIGAGLGVTSLVFLGLGGAQNSAIKNGGYANTAAIQSADSTGVAYNWIAGATGIVGGIGILVGAPFVLFNLPSKESAPASSKPAAFNVVLAPMLGGMSLSGAFR